MTTYAPAAPHTKIEEIAPDVFLVRGQIRLKKVMALARNMVIIRNDKELTLVDPIRLTESGEEELKKLGTVKYLIRLSHFHGLDDDYYKDTFGVELWATGGTSSAYPDTKVDKILTKADELPFPDSEVFVFESSKVTEGALIIRKSAEDGAMLITCDSLQYHFNDSLYTNVAMRVMMRVMGFKKTPIVIGPPWLGAAGEGAKDDFDKLVKMEFTQMVGGHGTVCKEGVKEKIQEAIDSAFKEK